MKCNLVSIHHGHLVRGRQVSDARDDIVEVLMGLPVEVAAKYLGSAARVGTLDN